MPVEQNGFKTREYKDIMEDSQNLRSHASMSGEVGNVILDAFSAFGPADVGARLSELTETLSPLLEILFYAISC